MQIGISCGLGQVLLDRKSLVYLVCSISQLTSWPPIYGTGGESLEHTSYESVYPITWSCYRNEVVIGTKTYGGGQTKR
jgi:hypothetical protein